MFITSFHEPARRRFSRDDRAYLIKDNATTQICDVIAASCMAHSNLGINPKEEPASMSIKKGLEYILFYRIMI